MSNLAEAEVLALMKAIVAVNMGRNPATRAVAEGYSMTFRGETLQGIGAAKRVILESVSQDPDAWLEFFADPDHFKPAISLRKALDDDMRAELSAHESGERFLVRLTELVASPIPQKEPVIDLRTPNPNPVSKLQPAS